MRNGKIILKRYFRLSIFVLLLLFAGGCVTFEGEIPVEIQALDGIYISPKNGDGIKDELKIPVSHPEIEGLKITGYRFVVRHETEGVFLL